MKRSTLTTPMAARSLWSRLLDLVAPRMCAVCGDRLAVSEDAICSRCNLHLPRTGFHADARENDMARGLWGRVPVERAAALIYYETHAESSRVVIDLKYHDHPETGQALGRMMAREFMGSGFFDGIDAIVPVPLARQRLRQRGYNQSEQLAIGISDITHLPIVTKALSRQHFQQSQTMLNRWQRQENVADTFLLKDGHQLQGKHVLLIDDVCTTGATLIACANALKDVEGIRISVLTLGFTKD